MPTYLFFFESNLITSDDLWNIYYQKESIAKNKIYCSFLNEKQNLSDKNLHEVLINFFPDCKIIKSGKITLLLGHDFNVIFIIFNTKEILLDNISGNFYPRGNHEAFFNKVSEIRNSISQSLDSMVVNRFLANIFLPEQLKDTFGRSMEIIAENKEKGNKRLSYKYYQNYIRFPFLVEFQTNMFLNFKKELETKIKNFYKSLSLFIDETGSLNIHDLSFYDLRLYSLENFDKDEVANIISISLIAYVFSLYTRIFDKMDIYRRRIDFFSSKLNKIPIKMLIELNNQLTELRRILFEEHSLIYINFIDRYLIYNEDIENPDLIDQIFCTRDSQVSTFRRNYELLNEKTTKIQSEIKTILLFKHEKIFSLNKIELKEKLEKINSELEFQELLADILKELQFEDVKINCGRRGHQEFGKDIVFSHKNKFNQREWSAIVVKQGKITQTQSSDINKKINKIIDQGSLALDIDYKDDKDSKFKITRVFVATNDTITDYAKIVIGKKLGGQVFFIDKNVLLDLVE